jgi:hypothetical protein
MGIDPITWFSYRQLNFKPTHFVLAKTAVTAKSIAWIATTLNGRYSLVTIIDEDYQKLFPSVDNSLITPMELIQKGTNVASLIQCGGIWFANGKFGVTWKLVQVVVQKPRGALSGQCFINLKSGDKEKLKSSVAPIADVVDQDDVPLRQEVEDTDDEEEPEPEPEPVVVAEPVVEPVKKKVIKKKV